MNLSKIIVLFVFLFQWPGDGYGQDTIRLQKIPRITLHSWYPEYKENPKLKIGEYKVLFSSSEVIERTLLRNNILTYNVPILKSGLKRLQKEISMLLKWDPPKPSTSNLKLGWILVIM